MTRFCFPLLFTLSYATALRSANSVSSLCVSVAFACGVCVYYSQVSFTTVVQNTTLPSVKGLAGLVLLVDLALKNNYQSIWWY